MEVYGHYIYHAVMYNTYGDERFNTDCRFLISFCAIVMIYFIVVTLTINERKTQTIAILIHYCVDFKSAISVMKFN